MASSLRIVIPCDTFAPDINGAARFAERLAGGLVRKGHEVHIIAPAFDTSEGPRIENHDGVDMIVHRLRSHKVPQHKTLLYQLLPLLRKSPLLRKKPLHLKLKILKRQQRRKQQRKPQPKNLQPKNPQKKRRTNSIGLGSAETFF